MFRAVILAILVNSWIKIKQMKRSIFLLLYLLLLLPAGSYGQPSGYFDVRSFGARGNGQTLETKAIQKAIDACAATGGTVVFPPGRYLTGTIYLKSNVTLRVEKGATILGSPNLEDYPVNDPDYIFFRKGILKRALIYAAHQENIAIEGAGTIDGQGANFILPDNFKGNSYSVRPYLIWMTRCKNVRTEGVRLRNSAFWMQHYLACDQVYIHNIDIFNHSNKNNDMIDIDDCHDVIISDVRGDSDDDGITLKSTSGRGVENVTITNCLLSSHCNAIKCGTESTAGFKHITISNCVVRPSKQKTVIYGKPAGISGISLEMVDGGTIDGISISNVIITGPEVPLFVRLGNRGRKYKQDQPQPETGMAKNISLSHITAYSAGPTGSSFTGLPGHPVENLSLSHIRLYYTGGGTAQDATREVPEKEKKYPEATMFGNLNAYGMYFRHVENLNLEDAGCYTTKPDMRPPLWLEDVKDAAVTGFSGDVLPDGTMVRIVQSADLYLSNIKPATSCSTLAEISGKGSKNIKLADNDLSKVQKAFTCNGGAEKTQIRLQNNFE